MTTLPADWLIATLDEIAEIRLGASVSGHPVGRALFSPAWQTQRMTTAEPGTEELEVACASLQAVIDFEEAHA